MVASHMAAGSSHPDEQGYITALRVGAAICALSAVRSWLLSRGDRMRSPAAVSGAERERLMLDDARDRRPRGHRGRTAPHE
jgi:hypothetical protein